jgi:transposase
MIATGGEKRIIFVMPTINGSTSNEVKPAQPERAQRRRFSNADKLRIVQGADACPSGKLGAFMRREGIYSSQLYAWRKQRDHGELDPGAPRKRAHAKAREQATAKRVAELERENRKLRRKLARAELISEIQKKIAGLLGIDLASPETNESAE